MRFYYNDIAIGMRSLHHIGEGCQIKKGELGCQSIKCVLIVFKAIIIQIHKNLKLHFPAFIQNRINLKAGLLWV